MEFEAPARDFSRLSVSDDPPPPSKKFQPLDFSQLNSRSMGFTARRNCTDFGDFFACKVKHKHLITFYGNHNFTVDGGPERDATDPINIKFLESIKNYNIREEFGEDGLHTIMVIKHRQVPKLAAAPKALPPGSVRLS